jgi:hypothetical protein
MYMFLRVLNKVHCVLAEMAKMEFKQACSQLGGWVGNRQANLESFCEVPIAF